MLVPKSVCMRADSQDRVSVSNKRFQAFNIRLAVFNMASAELYKALYKGGMMEKRILFFPHKRTHALSQQTRQMPQQTRNPQEKLLPQRSPSSSAAQSGKGRIQQRACALIADQPQQSCQGDRVQQPLFRAFEVSRPFTRRHLSQVPSRRTARQWSSTCLATVCGDLLRRYTIMASSFMSMFVKPFV